MLLWPRRADSPLPPAHFFCSTPFLKKHRRPVKFASVHLSAKPPPSLRPFLPTALAKSLTSLVAPVAPHPRANKPALRLRTDKRLKSCASANHNSSSPQLCNLYL